MFKPSIIASSLFTLIKGIVLAVGLLLLALTAWLWCEKANLKTAVGLLSRRSASQVGIYLVLLIVFALWSGVCWSHAMEAIVSILPGKISEVHEVLIDIGDSSATTPFVTFSLEGERKIHTISYHQLIEGKDFGKNEPRFLKNLNIARNDQLIFVIKENAIGSRLLDIKEP